jgi:hypothetical protein
LYISGLTAGQTWYVYNLSGAVVYQGKAGENAGTVYYLPQSLLGGKGIYIVQSATATLKVVIQ